MATTDVDATTAVLTIAQLICTDLGRIDGTKPLSIDQARQLQVYAKTLTDIHDWRSGVLDAAAKKLSLPELMAKLKTHPEVARLVGEL